MISARACPAPERRWSLGQAVLFCAAFNLAAWTGIIAAASAVLGR